MNRGKDGIKSDMDCMMRDPGLVCTVSGPFVVKQLPSPTVVDTAETFSETSCFKKSIPNYTEPYTGTGLIKE